MIKKITNDENLKNSLLNSMQTTYLRLLVHNYSDKQIQTHFELNKRDFNILQESIKEKFFTKDWLKIIARSFEIGILDPKDYVSNIVREEALRYTNIIFLNHIITAPSSFFAPKNTIRSLIIEFYDCCNKRFLKQAKNLPELNPVLKKYLQLKLNGLEKEVIQKLLNLTENTLDSVQRQLMNCFSSNCMYDVLRKALKYQHITNINTDEKELNDSLLNHAAAQINLIKFIKKQESNKLRKQFIYLMLLEFYAKKEHNTLVKPWSIALESTRKKAYKSDTIYKDCLITFLLKCTICVYMNITK